MSRELGSVELVVCRTIFASLGVLVFAFAVLCGIDFLFRNSPRASNVQSQSIAQLSPTIRKQTAQFPKESHRTTFPDQSAGIALLRKEMQATTRGVETLDTSIRFDPELLNRRLDGTSFAATEAVSNSPATGSLQSRQDREIFGVVFASADAATAYTAEEPLSEPPGTNGQPQRREASVSPASPAQSGEAPVSPASPPQPREAPVTPASLSREEVQQIQSRLRDLGYLSAATGVWDLKTRNALRDFKLVNRLGSSDTLDRETSEQLNSQTAISANHSFIGSWSTAPCRSANPKDLRVMISSRRVKSSTGSVCELQNFQSERGGWRVRANCSQGTQHWTGNGRFAMRGEKLVWTSERDVISYFRCN